MIGREAFQRPGRGLGSSAFQAGDHRLRGVHALGQLRLGQASRGPRVAGCENTRFVGAD